MKYGDFPSFFVCLPEGKLPIQLCHPAQHVGLQNLHTLSWYPESMSCCRIVCALEPRACATQKLLRTLQGGAPKIAKLVYKWLNNGLW